MTLAAHPQIFAIIPAAGRSVRMGQPKLLLPWGETTLLEHVLEVWKASRVDHVILVVHPDDDRLAEIGCAAGAHVVQPTVPPPDMKHSVRLGLDYASRFNPQPHDVWLMAPADMPGLSSATIDRLIATYETPPELAREPAQIWAVRDSSGKRGHPVLFAWSVSDDVATLSSDEGINALLDRHRVAYIAGEAAELGEDLDTPEDYERLRAGFRPQEDS